MGRIDVGYRFEFRWARPRLTTYRAAPPKRAALVLNRYPGVVIGVGLVLGSRVLSLTWGKPGKVIHKRGGGDGRYAPAPATEEEMK